MCKKKSKNEFLTDFFILNLLNFIIIPLSLLVFCTKQTVKRDSHFRHNLTNFKKQLSPILRRLGALEALCLLLKSNSFLILIEECFTLFRSMIIKNKAC